jgi:hypothetical protein
VKHSDLKSIREYAGLLVHRDMPGTAEMLNDMAIEIEALRDALRRELDEGDLEACGQRPDLRELLPPLT